MSGPREEFLSEEDLDLRNLSEDELIAWWNLWLQQAQATNDLDAATYEHGVFERDPAVASFHVRDARRDVEIERPEQGEFEHRDEP